MDLFKMQDPSLDLIELGLLMDSFKKKSEPIKKKECCSNRRLVQVDFGISCSNCGTVQENYLYSNDTESINYSTSDSVQVDPTRTSKIDTLFESNNRTGIIQGGSNSYKLNKLMQRSGSISSKDRSRMKVYFQIDRIVESLGASDSISHIAKAYFLEIVKQERLCNSKVIGDTNLCRKHTYAKQKVAIQFTCLKELYNQEAKECLYTSYCRNMLFGGSKLCNEHFHKLDDFVQPELKNYCTVLVQCSKNTNGNGLCLRHIELMDSEQSKVNELNNKLDMILSFKGRCQIKCNHLFRRSMRAGLISGLVYYACKKESSDRNTTEIAFAASNVFRGITSADIAKGCNKLLTILPNLNSLETEDTSGTDFVERFCSSFNLDYKYISLANKILENVNELKFLNAHRPESIAGSVLYLVIIECNLTISRKDLSIVTGISETTIEKIYKSLMLNKELVLFEINIKI